jgi:hypothetical protein
MQDNKVSDGNVPTSGRYTLVSNPVLYVFDFLTVVVEREFKDGKAMVLATEVPKRASGKPYTCIVYQAGMMTYYRLQYVCVHVCL